MPLSAFPKCFLDALCVTREMSVDQWIDLSAQFDVDGLEFYWGFTPPENPREWERLRQRVEKQQRSIPMMCYSSDFTKPTLPERKEEIEKQKRAIRAISGLGGKFCRVLSGQRRPDVRPDQGLRWVRECIEELVPFAAEQRIVLIIENHYKDGYWDYPEFAQRMDAFLALVSSIGETEWFGVNYDPSNAIIAGDDPIQLLEAVKHRVKTMHASDRYFEGGTLEDLRRIEAQPQTGYASILRHGVIGRGLNDYDRIFSILKDAGFKGWISIEDGPDPATGVADIAESAKFLRRKMKQFGLV
ncbi:MAG: sugar phosphate isomerase/epimerase [Verrucomicrobia bacterium]|nr:sugar phosphate isomerase/epimerase [Verrucomicrobiota bacterium]